MTERRVGHYLLLILSILFEIEALVFLMAAFNAAGRDQLLLTRNVMLAIGVSATAAGALYGFLRRVNGAVTLLFGLLFLQPVLSALLPDRAPKTALTIRTAVFCGLVAAALFWMLYRDNRPAK